MRDEPITGDSTRRHSSAAEEEGDRLSADELVAMVANLLFAGHDTTRSYLSIALPLLLTHPEQLDALRAAPTLYASAAEE
ncbi:MAG: cytochrome P450, partial [Acidimicrobiia bacterium]